MKKQKGLTIIELMVAIVVMMILVTSAVPTFRFLFGKKNLGTTAKLFQQSIQLARAEAAERGAIVRVMPSIPGNSWAAGWRLEFTNDDGDIEVIRAYDSIIDNPIFQSADFNQGNPIQIIPNGQAVEEGDLVLFYQNCNGSSEQYDFELLLSGLLEKTISQQNCP